MSADPDFHINYRGVKLEAPFLVMVQPTDASATCHADALRGPVLRHLATARNVDALLTGLQDRSPDHRR